MNKIILIIRREYLTRVRKRSFIVMTFLGPILMAAIIVLPAYFAHMAQQSEQKVMVLDETGWFYQKFQDQDNIRFTYIDKDLEQAKAEALQKKELLLYIPLPKLNVPENAELFSSDSPGLDVKTYVKMIMKQVVENKKMLALGIHPEDIKSAKVNINLATIKMNENGSEEKVNTDVVSGLAIFSGLLIYFSIFMFGTQVLRGVIEEKSNRIVEVMISSVKPFQLMLGKIIGIAFVGLTQFFLWIMLTVAIIGVFQGTMGGGHISADMQQSIAAGSTVAQHAGNSLASKGHLAMAQVNELFSGINFGVMIGSFLFYFLFGYLMYAALFAGIGGAIDHDSDIQQFTLPVSAPLIFAVAMTGVVVGQPNGPLAVWLSMIPLTSPVIMMIRIPFGVPYWEVIVSAVLLIVSFLLATFVAGKVYRIGILVYGKKITYRQLWKWLRN